MEEVEKEARRFGWVPKEEFRGGEDNWVDAQTFVKRGNEINPILRANNERLKKELEEESRKHREQLDELKATTEEFKKFQKDAYERKQKDYESQIEALKKQRKEAIRENDGERIVEIEDQMDELREEAASIEKPKDPPPAKASEVQLDPSLKAWLDRNDWYGKDTETTQMVNAIGAAIKSASPDLTGEKFLEKLDERIQARFPELYESPNSAKAGAVDSGGGSSSRKSSKKESYDNLPDEAKKACDRYVKQGLMTKEDYIAAYDWGN